MTEHYIADEPLAAGDAVRRYRDRRVRAVRRRGRPTPLAGYAAHDAATGQPVAVLPALALSTATFATLRGGDDG